jgi:hypothetical protein
MPWGYGGLPVVTDDLGIPTYVGPAGSNLKGVEAEGNSSDCRRGHSL